MGMCCASEKPEQYQNTKKKYQSHNNNDDNDDAEFIRQQQRELSKYDKQKIKEPERQQKNVPIQGKGVQIGGNQAQANETAEQHEILAKAAEERLLKQQNRGMNNQGTQMEYQMKKQKLEEAARYEQERKGEPYNLKWD